MVWAKTDRIGCGRTATRSTNLVIICNYASAGNFLHESVYKFGSACSDCGGLKCNSEYPGLCGEVKMIQFDEPFRK